MITQIELEEGAVDGIRPCYWVSHTREEHLIPGIQIILSEIGVATPVTVRRTFVSLADGHALPEKARYGQLLEILN